MTNILTAEQIVRVHELREGGKSWNEIKTLLGYKGHPTTLLRANKFLTAYLSRGTKLKRVSKPYKDAVRMIKGGAHIGPKLTNGVTSTGEIRKDHYQILEDSLRSFQGAIEQFIDEEVKRKMKHKEKEYEEKLKQIETLKDEAKQSNWVEGLRRKFGN